MADDENELVTDGWFADKQFDINLYYWPIQPKMYSPKIVTILLIFYLGQIDKKFGVSAKIINYGFKLIHQNKY